MPLVPGPRSALPVVGANMDTVVGQEMAKTLALEGGLGFLHRNSSIAEQAERIRYVKTRHSYVIDRPVVLPSAAPPWPRPARPSAPTTPAASSSRRRRERAPGGDPLAPRHAPRPAAGRPPGQRVHDPAGRLATRPPSVDDRGGRAGDVRAPGGEAAPGGRAEPDPRPHHHAGPEALQAEAALLEGRAGPPARGRGDRRHRRLPGAGRGAAGRGGGLPPARRGPRRLRRGGARGQGVPAEASRACRSWCGNVATARGRALAGRPGRGRGEGRGGPGPRLPHAPRDGGAACPSSRRCARPGSAPRARSRSSPTAASRTTRTSSWPSPAAPPR